MRSLLVVHSRRIGSKIWQFLDVSDILELSVCSRSAAGLVLSHDVIQELLARNPRIGFLGTFRLAFSSDVTFGMFRRILFRLISGTDALVTVDSASGRVVLDIGSAFNDKDAYFAAAVPFADDDDLQVGPEFGIQKHLEIASVDEYDDFAPRHPLPKERTHRRGDSYFNSDIEGAANEALAGLDLQNIASLAMDLEHMSIPNTAPPRRHRKVSSGSGLPLSPSPSGGGGGGGVTSPGALTPHNLQTIAQQALVGIADVDSSVDTQ